MATATHDNELKMYIWADISSRMQILASARPSGGDGRLAGGCHDPDNWLHGVAGRGAHISTVAGRKAQVCDPVRPCQPWRPAEGRPGPPTALLGSQEGGAGRPLDLVQAVHLPAPRRAPASLSREPRRAPASLSREPMLAHRVPTIPTLLH